MPAQLPFPWRAICFLESEFGGAMLGGSGVLIRNDTVLTAAHCVFVDDHPATRVRVSPGAYLSSEGNIVRPQLAWAYPGNYHYPEQWQGQSGSGHIGSVYDYALIVLPSDQAFDWETVGNMAVKRVSAEDLNRQVCQLSGYPVEYGQIGRQYQGIGKLADWNDDRLYYRFGTQGGQSGAPVYYFLAQAQDGRTVDMPYVAGVHTTAYDSGLDSAIRINRTVMENLLEWMGIA